MSFFGIIHHVNAPNVRLCERHAAIISFGEHIPNRKIAHKIKTKPSVQARKTPGM